MKTKPQYYFEVPIQYHNIYNIIGCLKSITTKGATLKIKEDISLTIFTQQQQQQQQLHQQNCPITSMSPTNDIYTEILTAKHIPPFILAKMYTPSLK